MTEKESKRPRSVTVLAVLIFIEGLAMFLIGLFNFYWSEIYEAMQIEGVYPSDIIYASWTIGLALPLGVLALIATFGLLRLWPTAWLMAMIVQGVMLFFFLVIHFTVPETNTVEYVVMTYAIFIVWYLNYSEVQASFRPKFLTEESHQHE